MTAALLVVAALVLPFVAVLSRRRLVRRLATRNSLRRPVETVLVILGSLFGTAIITGSLVVADTLDWSIRQVAYNHLGPIDEVVSTRDPSELASLRRAADRLLVDGTVDGVLALETLPATVTAGEGSRLQVLPGAQLVETDLEAAARFGDERAPSGLAGPNLSAGQTVVNADVADGLGVGPGDELTVHAYGQERRLTVTRVVPTVGVAGFRGTSSAANRSRNLFVPVGTIDDLALAAFEQAAATGPAGTFVPPERIVAVSNPGGVIEGGEATEEVVPALRAALGGDAPPVVTLKSDVLDTAAETSRQLGDLFAAMGAFGTLAGVLLLVNLFVILADERRSELGTLRALGMRRSLLVATFASEGWLYALVAAIVGTVAGVGLGRGIVALVSGAIEGVGDDVGLRLDFSVDAASVVIGFAAGLAISVATVVGASVRTARLNVIRAIRELPEPPRSRSPRLAVAALAGALACAVWAAVALAVDDAYGTMLGPALTVVGVAVALGIRRRSAWLVPVASLAVMAWAVVALRISLAQMEGDPDVNVFVVQGVVLTGAAVALVTHQQDRIVRLVARLARGRRWLAVRLGLAHPTARKLRTGLTVAMYALVVFTLSFVTVLAGLFDRELASATERLSGGFDLVARWPSSSAAAIDDIAAAPGVTAVAPLSTAPMSLPGTGDRPAGSWLLSGFDQRLVDAGAPSLASRGRYRTDEAAYRAVLADPELAIVDPIFVQINLGATGASIGVGDTFVAVDPFSGRQRRFEVAALARTDLAFNGALVGRDAVAALVGTTPTPTRAYVAAAADRDPSALARQLMADNAALGVEADAIGDIVATSLAVEEQFFQLARGYLGLGLVVGIAGLGVVMVRAVRDRRREIGVLRSLGFGAGATGATLVVEALYVSVVGAVLGSVLGVLTAYNVVSGTDLLGYEVPFGVPILEVLGLAGVTMAVSVAATLAPARAAARVRPAVALRISD